MTTSDAPTDTLRMALGITMEPELERTTMSSKKKQTSAQPTEAPQIELTPASAKRGKTPKMAKVGRATKPEKKREPKEKGLVVFAFRLTEAERDAIHKAAGPARASRFVRTIAVAAASEDDAMIRATIREAREARQ